MENLTEQKQDRLLESVCEHLEAGNAHGLGMRLGELHPAETAKLLESLPAVKRKLVWEQVPADHEGDVLAQLNEDARASIIDEMAHDEIIAAAAGMEMDDLAHVLEELPAGTSLAIFNALEEDNRKRLETTLGFEEGTAGRLMGSEVISVRKNVSLAVVLRYLKWQLFLPKQSDALMVIAEDGTYLGKLLLADVVTGNAGTLVEEVMQVDADWIYADATNKEVVALFDRRDLVSLAVLDRERKLLGRITVDDIVDEIRALADKAMMNSAGLKEEEDLFAPVMISTKRRALWLGINLATVFFAAWVIGRFEEVLDKLVALAILLPVVASMGGIAGSQTLTLTIRGLARGQVSAVNMRWLMNKEVTVGLLNGLIWALVVGLVTMLWFQQWGIGMVIALAMIINLMAAAFSGVIIPVLLDRNGIDPALSGAVILTTVTDVVGFMSFLGLATWWLI